MTRAKKGFTLIELTLSLAFISVLLIAIAFTIIQVAATYNKGLTVKSVTTAGSDLATDLQRSISASMPFSIEGSSTRYVVDSFGGRLCLGKYSYIWNYGKALNEGSATNRYSSGSNIIRFIKVPDVGGSYCLDYGLQVDPVGAIDLLSVGDRNLSIHSFKISSDSSAYDELSASRLYTVSYTIGTNNKDALTADYTSCKDPGQPGADPSYCSVQDFAISIIAGNLYVK